MRRMEVNENTVLAEDITIIYDDDKVIKIFNNLEPDYENGRMKGITLVDCLKTAKPKGYAHGTITVLSESYLSGDIYRYNNYGKNEWCLIGNLIGFA